MTTERLDIQQMVAAASGYKFDDVERQKQYERLLADLNLIVEENTFDQIWDDIGLMETFTKKLNEIMVLVEVEKIETVWDRERCVEWAEEAGIEDAESYVDNNFKIFDDHIEIKGDLDLEGSQVQVLPFGLTKIGGCLWLENSQVRELPAGLTTIGGYLDLVKSQVRELPAGLTTIGGDLFLENSQITDIPDSLRIEADVYATVCPQSLIDKLNKMKEKGNIKGRVITTY